MLSFRSRVRAVAFGLALVGSYPELVQAGTLMPPGEVTFFDGNGVVLSAGCIFFYIPGTNFPKATYQNSGQTVANTNPVQLDAAGRAIIYGTGTYRQVVNASGGGASPCSPAGAQIWDQLTASTDSSATIYAGASAGTPNSVTVNASAFSGTDGQVINYISTNTNTAAATINPSGFGAVAIVRDSATGPGPLIGGELVATNAVSLIYDATAGTFHILSPVTWPNTSGVPVGTVVPVAGFTAPTNYAFANGQLVSRTTYSLLLSNLTLGQTGTISSGSPIITALADTTSIGYGMPVESVGIPGGATILSCTSTTCTMSANATVSRSGTMTFFAYSNGDGSTTFGLPDYRGTALIGRDLMSAGGVTTAANISQISTTIATNNTSTSATVGSATGLAVGMFITNANVPASSTITSISGTTITMSGAATATASANAARFSPLVDAQALGIRGGAMIKAQNAAELAPHNHAVFLNDPGHTHTTGAGTAVVVNTNINTGVGFGAGSSSTNALTILSATTGITVRDTTGGGGSANQTALTGSGNPMLVFNTHRTVNYAIRLVP
jgi:microcystin-dependent protein